MRLPVIIQDTVLQLLPKLPYYKLRSLKADLVTFWQGRDLKRALQSASEIYNLKKNSRENKTTRAKDKKRTIGVRASLRMRRHKLR